MEYEDIYPETKIMITPMDVVEYIFCPRFIYFMYCLSVPQHEELRWNVMKGRQIHESKSKENRYYMRKRIGCVGREINVYLASERLHIRGEVDEVLHLADGTLAPLDYKLTEYKDFLYRTHRMQSTIYGMLIEDVYGKPVERGYIVYIKSGGLLKEIIYDEKMRKRALEMVWEIIDIIATGRYPKGVAGARCVDCCYKNICA